MSNAAQTGSEGVYREPGESDEIQRFRLNPEACAKVARKRILAVAALAAVGAGALVAFNVAMSGGSSGSLLVALVPVGVGGALFFTMLVLGARSGTNPGVASHEVAVGRRVLRRVVSGMLPAEVLRPEVTRINETKDGLWVVSDAQRKAVFLSRMLDGYPDARARLSAWKPIDPIDGRAWSFTTKHERWMGPRDAVAGTELARDPSLRDELKAIREAVPDRATVYAKPAVNPKKTLALWLALIVMFLAIWQFLSPTPAQTQRHTPRPRPAASAP